MKIFIHLLRKQWVYSPRTLLITLLILLGSSNAMAQEQKITLSEGPKTIQAALEEIEKQTKMTIAYNESDINVQHVIDVNITNQTLP